MYRAINVYRVTRILFCLLTKYFLCGYRYRALYDICTSCARNISCSRTLSRVCTEISFGKFAEKDLDSARKYSDRLPIAVSQITSTKEVHVVRKFKKGCTFVVVNRVMLQSQTRVADAYESDSIGIEITGFTRV